MAHIRCPNGEHVYDADKYTCCPFCTPAPTSGSAAKGAKTVVISGMAASSDLTSQIVGWLVVTNGKGRGHDLRILPGQNQIGRDKGDIVLNFGDSSISREKQALLSYDPLENLFLISHGEGKNLTRVNGKMVMDAQVLAPFDRIRLGQTELLFVPLCGEQFNWSQVVTEHANPATAPVQDVASQGHSPDNRGKTKLFFE